MLKKILLAAATAAALTTSASAIAGSVYMGPSAVIQDAMTKTSAYRGFSPKMTLGYGDMGDESYFGAEIFGIPTSAPLTDSSADGAPSLKISRSFGASLIPGMMIGSQTVAFTRIGFITSKFNSVNIYKTGGQLGIGLMATVSPNWDVRGEYDYTVYGGVSDLGSPKVDEFALAFLYRFEDVVYT